MARQLASNSLERKERWNAAILGWAQILAYVVAFGVFAASWIYCISTYGYLFGVGLGWLPSLITAGVAGGIFYLAVVILLSVFGWQPLLIAAAYGIAVLIFQFASAFPILWGKVLHVGIVVLVMAAAFALYLGGVAGWDIARNWWSQRRIRS